MVQVAFVLLFLGYISLTLSLCAKNVINTFVEMETEYNKTLKNI